LTLLITSYLESSPHKQGLPPPLPLWTLQWHVCKQIQNYILKPIQNHVVIIRSCCGTNSRLPVGPIQTLVPVACIHEQQEAGNFDCHEKCKQFKFSIMEGFAQKTDQNQLVDLHIVDQTA
jgi:hypothetical protein